MVNKLLYGIDQLSRMVGHAFAWCIIILTFGTCYEVFVRYVLDNPTSWAFDMSYLMYGGLFFMGGAYTLSRNGHVRGDFLYRCGRRACRRIIELTLYILFFFPGRARPHVRGLGLRLGGLQDPRSERQQPGGNPDLAAQAAHSVRRRVAGIQGLAEVMRCIICIRDNRWPPRLHDVEELEDVLIEQHAAEEAAKQGGAK